MMKKLTAVFLIILCAVSGCTGKKEDRMTYISISQQEAEKMMRRDDGHIIVDVRRQDEYDAGHIPGAVLIPNESISAEKPDLLPDTEQIILIYCRSGNRSKQAAQKLADMGYKNVYEFGGINTWKGELVMGSTETELIFESFDGGGPEYSITLDDPSLVSYTQEKRYDSGDHEEMDGASFDVIFTFAGLKPGKTKMTVQARSPVADNWDGIYSVSVDQELNVSVEMIAEEMN